MRKIIVSNFLSVDGYFASESGDTEWVPEDTSIDAYMEQQLQGVDTILFGCKTHEMMSTYWPHAISDDQPPVIKKSMNELEKIVFSETGNIADWSHSHQAPELSKEYIQALKAKDGKDIIVFGSGTIVEQLAELGAIDVYQLFIVPKLLGNGRRMTQDTPEIMLTLENSQAFASGTVLVRYDTNEEEV